MVEKQPSVIMTVQDTFAIAVASVALQGVAIQQVSELVFNANHGTTVHTKTNYTAVRVSLLNLKICKSNKISREKALSAF